MTLLFRKLSHKKGKDSKKTGLGNIFCKLCPKHGKPLTSKAIRLWDLEFQPSFHISLSTSFLNYLHFLLHCPVAWTVTVTAKMSVYPYGSLQQMPLSQKCTHLKLQHS